MELIFKNFLYLNKNEHEKILSIRNTENIKMYMKRNTSISIKEHLEWILSLEKDDSKKYFAIFFNNKIIGSINMVNIQKEKGYLGLYFKKKTNPLFSSLATFIFLEKVFNDIGLKVVWAEVLEKNTDALKFDKSLGFEFVMEKKENKKNYFVLKLTNKKWQEQKSRHLAILNKKASTIKYEFI